MLIWLKKPKHYTTLKFIIIYKVGKEIMKFGDTEFDHYKNPFFRRCRHCRNNTTWDKVSSAIKREFDNKPSYNKFFLKTKINSMVMKLQISTIKKSLRQASYLFSKIKIDPILKKRWKVLPLTSIKQWKYIEKEVTWHITEYLEISSGESDESNEE